MPGQRSELCLVVVRRMTPVLAHTHYSLDAAEPLEDEDNAGLRGVCRCERGVYSSTSGNSLCNVEPSRTRDRLGAYVILRICVPLIHIEFATNLVDIGLGVVDLMLSFAVGSGDALCDLQHALALVSSGRYQRYDRVVLIVTRAHY
ncbi:hypothetical protein TSAR_001593 [Trichomalopsis sarcophagae]|uniref:Uncharacterized protein n=1 Tax=Trichomalopsis sarcophagae TaxID=543379 RepID=A0A232ELF8_9HYME|nr:hypothetical protein TSAR_001593 [Trichomalopsis sarcophagae]